MFCHVAITEQKSTTTDSAAQQGCGLSADPSMTKTTKFGTWVSQSTYLTNTPLLTFSIHLDSRAERRHSYLHAAQKSERATEAEVGTNKSRPKGKQAAEKLYGLAVVAGVHLRSSGGGGVVLVSCMGVVL